MHGAAREQGISGSWDVGGGLAARLTMTVAEARGEYRWFMSRMDVASAFGHGCSIAGSHPVLRRLRDEANRLLVQLRALEVAAGERPLKPARSWREHRVLPSVTAGERGPVPSAPALSSSAAHALV
jgi:hypothetical protein